MFILLNFVACMPKIWQAQCENNDNCEKFSVVSIGDVSEKPFEISRIDTKIEVRANKYQLTEHGMSVYIEGRDICRGFHSQIVSYQVSSDKKRHNFYSKYQVDKNELVQGDYSPCAHWEPTDEQTTLSVLFKNKTKPILIPLTNNQDNEFVLPLSIMGWGLLADPNKTELTYQAETSGVSNIFSSPLPERNQAWICDAMQSFKGIAAVDDYKTWELLFESPAGMIAIPYVYNDSPRLSHFRTAIWQCDSNTLENIKTELRASRAEYPAGKGHINYQFTQLFGTDKQERRTRASTQKSNAQKNPRSPLVGTYRCTVQGQIAYFRIDKSGKFNLKVEIEKGSAQGTCAGTTCKIDNIYKSAITFTGSLDKFKIRERGNALIMNDTTRCVRR